MSLAAIVGNSKAVRKAIQKRKMVLAADGADAGGSDLDGPRPGFVLETPVRAFGCVEWAYSRPGPVA